MEIIGYVFRNKPNPFQIGEVTALFRMPLALYLGETDARYVTTRGRRSSNHRVWDIADYKKAITEYKGLEFDGVFGKSQFGLIMSHPNRMHLLEGAIKDGVLERETPIVSEMLVEDEDSISGVVRKLDEAARWAAARLMNGDAEQVRRIMENSY